MRSFDVTLVGGGLIGLAIGYGLAARGVRTALVDAGTGAFRAASGNFGLVWVQSKGSTYRPYASLTRRSGALWPEFARELEAVSGVDAGFCAGGLTLCASPEALAERAAFMRHQFDADLPVPDAYEMLDRTQVRALVPEAGPAIEGASYCRLDAAINPLALLRALTIAFRRVGGTLFSGTMVEAITHSGAGFEIAGTGLRLGSEKLVLAAGLGNAQLGPMVGLELPLTPLRGQMLITEKQPPWLGSTTHIVRQMPEGGVLIGDSKEEVGYDKSTVPGVLGNIAARAVEAFPRLARVNVVRAWGCLRVMTPDGFPVYEHATSCPGAFAFCVHSGVTLAAAHAREAVEAVVAGRLPDGYGAFSVKRFAIPSARRDAA